MSSYYDDFGGIYGDVLGDAAAFGRAAPGGRMPALGTPAKLAARPMAAQPVMFPPQPAWRPQISPGVAMPGEGLQPLPMTPSAGNGIFALALQTITFSARPQVPFRCERLLVTVRRSGAANVILQANGFNVGRQNQFVQIGPMDIEIFAATAFDTRLALDPATPGMDITLVVTANPAVAGADTLTTSITILGRSIR